LFSRTGAGRILEVGHRLRLWRVAAVETALAPAATLFAAVPGSVAVVKYAPPRGNAAAARLPTWTRPCLDIDPGLERPQIDFCARVDGRVIGWMSKPDGETHLLVTGGLHITVVELKPGLRKPSWGARITAVGPMTTTGGLRELQAVR
jgi:hypothetical protein